MDRVAVTDTGPFTRFEDLAVGSEARISRRFTAEAVDAFAQVSGDSNPLHVDQVFAARTSIGRRVAHGMLSAAYVSSVIGTQLPGPGALWFEQTFEFLVPVLVDDEVEFIVRIDHKSEVTRTLVVSVRGTNQHGTLVLKGHGKIMVLESKTEAPAADGSKSPRAILVTGASRGIGAATAIALGRLGHRIVINYLLSRERAEQVASSIHESGGLGLTFCADVNDGTAVRNMITDAEDRLGLPIDVLVNNASGSTRQKPLLEHEWADMEAHLGTQVKGALNCIRAVAPGMIERGRGRIISIGSTYTWGAPPANLAGYVTAKAALAALTKCAAVELGPHGVRVNMISPGMTETDLISNVPERIRKVFAMQTPLRRLALPEDVAAAVAMLVSPAGDFIHGADIPVAGGGVM
jgi:3-oxoacyl-[acyl-carrier protein] reductase